MAGTEHELYQYKRTSKEWSGRQWYLKNITTNFSVRLVCFGNACDLLIAELGAIALV